jgi:integrase
MSAGVKDGIVKVNPCADVDLPEPTHEEMVFLTHEEVRAVADAIDPWWRTLVLTAAYTGLRAGELGGLRRKYLDPLRGTLRVEETLKHVGREQAEGDPTAIGDRVFGPPKSERSRRTVTLPKFLREMLKEHLADPSPGGNGPDDLVFVGVMGGPVRQELFYRRHFKPAVKAALPPEKHRLRFHDLRHTCVAFLIDAKRHPKEIQEQLGHSSIEVTMDRYGHLMPRAAEELAAALDAGYRSADGDGNVTQLRRAEDA